MEEEDDKDVQDETTKVLYMAKDMIAEATNVRIPAAGVGRCAPFELVQIRVEIHAGSVASSGGGFPSSPCAVQVQARPALGSLRVRLLMFHLGD